MAKTLLICCFLLSTSLTAANNCVWRLVPELTQHAVLEPLRREVAPSRLPHLQPFAGDMAVAPVFWRSNGLPYLFLKHEFTVRDARMQMILDFVTASPDKGLYSDGFQVSPTQFLLVGDTFAHRLQIPTDEDELPILQGSFRVSYLGQHLPAALTPDGKHLVIMNTGRRDELNREVRLVFIDWATGEVERVRQLEASHSNAAPFNELDYILKRTFRQSNFRVPRLFLSHEFGWIVPYPFTRHLFQVDLRTGEIRALAEIDRLKGDWVVPLGVTRDGQHVQLLRSRDHQLALIQLGSSSQVEEIPIQGSFKGALFGYSTRNWEAEPSHIPIRETSGLGGVLVEEHGQALVGSTKGLIQIDLENAKILSQGLADTQGKRAAFPRLLPDGSVGFWQVGHPDAAKLTRGKTWSFVIIRPETEDPSL